VKESQQQHNTYNSLLFLPEDYDSRQQWPLVIFLHGSGERGSDLQLLKKQGPPKHVARGEEFPFILLAPQVAAGDWWNAEELERWFHAATPGLHIDPAQIYLTGISMGGFGTWHWSGLYPQRWAALLPICGGGERDQAAAIAHIPIWTFHGDQDEVVLPERTIEMVDALKHRGSSVKFTLYENVNHDSWTRTYEDPAVWEWLLAQRKPT
jgi:predicted peptidase